MPGSEEVLDWASLTDLFSHPHTQGLLEQQAAALRRVVRLSPQGLRVADLLPLSELLRAAIAPLAVGAAGAGVFAEPLVALLRLFGRPLQADANNQYHLLKSRAALVQVLAAVASALRVPVEGVRLAAARALVAFLAQNQEATEAAAAGPGSSTLHSSQLADGIRKSKTFKSLKDVEQEASPTGDGSNRPSTAANANPPQDLSQFDVNSMAQLHLRVVLKANVIPAVRSLPPSFLPYCFYRSTGLLFRLDSPMAHRLVGISLYLLDFPRSFFRCWMAWRSSACRRT